MLNFSSYKTFAFAFALLAFLTVAGYTMAEERDSGVVKLTIEDAVRMALEKNSSILRAGNELQRAKSVRDEAISLALPDIDLTASYTHFGNIPKAELFGETIKLSPDEITTVNLGVSQRLYSGAVMAGLRGAKHLVASAESERYVRINDTSANVRILAYTLLLDKEIIAAQEESVIRLSSHVKDSRERQEVGLNTSYDTLRFETSLAEATPKLIQARNNYASTMTRLLDLIGADPTGDLELSGKLEFTPTEVSLFNALETSLQKRPEIISARENFQVAHEYLMAAYSESMPSVRAFGDFIYTDSAGDISGGNEWRDEWNAGIKLEMNLYDGGGRSSREKQKLLDKSNADIEFERVERMVKLETRIAYDEMKRATELIKSQEKSVEYATETFRIAKERHGIGMLTQLELLDTELSLTNAKIIRSRSLYEYLVAKVKLERAMGVLEESIQ